MKISVLTPSVSHNALGRAYILARVLQRRYKVEIIGPSPQGRIWEPLAEQKGIEVRGVLSSPKLYGIIPQTRVIQKEISGDVIYASKPIFTSYGVGLIEKFLHQKPLVLDIDDWQMGFRRETLKVLTPIRRIKALLYSMIYFNLSSSYWNNYLGEQLAEIADEVTVSNNFLEERFGGTIVWHGRDTTTFDPNKFRGNYLRRKLEIPEGKKTVMFFGTPRAYKGIEDLIEALRLLRDRRVLLVLVGLDKDPYSSKLKKLAYSILGNKQIRLLGLQSFKKVPEFLALADLIAIPQRKNFATVGQVPAKIFDAMAMAKPIVATKVGDLPEILDGCGWIVEPEKPEELAEAIQYVCDHPAEAEMMGCKAREKCVAEYSWDAMERVLLRVFEKYE